MGMSRTEIEPTLLYQPVTAQRSPRISARYTRMAVSSVSMEKYFHAGAADEARNCEEGRIASDYAKSLVAPGQTVVTDTPVCLSSRASAVENDSTNTFAAPYSAL